MKVRLLPISGQHDPLNMTRRTFSASSFLPSFVKATPAKTRAIIHILPLSLLLLEELLGIGDDRFIVFFLEEFLYLLQFGPCCRHTDNGYVRDASATTGIDTKLPLTRRKCRVYTAPRNPEKLGVRQCRAKVRSFIDVSSLH